MKLNLERPILFFDLETTGLDISTDKIVEISYIKVFPNGNEESKTMRLNPQVHIPESSSKIHGIYDEDVKDCPTLQDVAHDLATTFADADWAGFNSNRFDIPMFVEQMARVGENIDLTHIRMIDVQNIFHKMEKRTLSAAYRFYCDKELTDAHSALADTRATYEVLEAQLDRYAGELKNEVQFLAEFSQMGNNIDLAGRFVADENGEAIVNFGKYKGKHLREILVKDPSYYNWIQQGNFTQNTKQVLEKLKLQYAGR